MIVYTCMYIALILCRSFADDNDVNQWGEILHFLFECCNLEQPQLYESALHIIRYNDYYVLILRVSVSDKCWLSGYTLANTCSVSMACKEFQKVSCR